MEPRRPVTGPLVAKPKDGRFGSTVRCSDCAACSDAACAKPVRESTADPSPVHVGRARWPSGKSAATVHMLTADRQVHMTGDRAAPRAIPVCDAASTLLSAAAPAAAAEDTQPAQDSIQALLAAGTISFEPQFRAPLMRSATVEPASKPGEDGNCSCGTDQFHPGDACVCAVLRCAARLSSPVV